MDKKNIVVIFGGRSSEHDVSCISVLAIANAINRDKYNVTLVGITKEGKWLLADNVACIEDGSWRQSTKQAVISPDATRKELIICENGDMTTSKIDVIFPVLHGLYGEDGTIQGLFEMADIPYVGCGVLASACSMDKLYTKIIVDTLGINQARYIGVRRPQLKDLDKVVAEVETTLEYPVFVKPSCAGSSKGVSKAHNREELVAALKVADAEDSKILIEETIVGRELECGVYGSEEVDVSGVGEVLAAAVADFYDFDAKYNNAESKTVIGPDLPEGKTEEIRQAAMAIFKALDCHGLSRVDFFLENGTNRVVFNEINTLPGFTSISMYPMLWKAKGYNIEALVEKLIESSYTR